MALTNRRAYPVWKGPIPTISFELLIGRWGIEVPTSQYSTMQPVAEWLRSNRIEASTFDRTRLKSGAQEMLLSHKPLTKKSFHFQRRYTDTPNQILLPKHIPTFTSQRIHPRPRCSPSTFRLSALGLFLTFIFSFITFHFLPIFSPCHLNPYCPV